MSASIKYTKEELERIRLAVKNAEAGVSGEIVPVVVEKSGYYTIAKYRAGVIMATFAFLVLIIIARYDENILLSPVAIFLGTVLAALVGVALTSFEPVRRLMLTQKHINHATRVRAESVFLAEEVFNTRHRTGIMIFISLFEQEVIIMADRGISRVVEQKQWDNVVNDLTAQIKKRHVVDGLEAAIRQCSQILIKQGFHRTADDVNELRDNLRMT